MSEPDICTVPPMIRPPSTFELLTWTRPFGAAITPDHSILLPDRLIPEFQHEPPAENRAGMSGRAGLIFAAPLTWMRPVATIVTPVSAGALPEIVTSPAT